MGLVRSRLWIPAGALSIALGVGLLPGSACAITMLQFDFSGSPIEGGVDPGYNPDVTVEFTFDETCMTSSCQLTVKLTYNDSGGLSTIGQTLSGVVFDAFDENAAGFDLDVTLSNSTAVASSLVGAGSDDAYSDFGVSDGAVDVSGHWGFVSGYASTHVPPLGSNVLSSVGDVLPDMGVLGNMDLFDGIISGVEPSPPDGTSFSIVDPNTCTGPPGSPTCGSLAEGFQDSQNRAWVQNMLTATLEYDGSTHKLTDIDNVDPIFGTEGRPIPEPSVVALLLLGVTGLAAAGTRLRQRG